MELFFFTSFYCKIEGQCFAPYRINNQFNQKLTFDYFSIQKTFFLNYLLLFQEVEAENAAADDATADDEEPQGPEGKPPTRFGWFIAVWVKKASVYLSLQHTNGKKKTN